MQSFVPMDGRTKILPRVLKDIVLFRTAAQSVHISTVWGNSPFCCNKSTRPPASSSTSLLFRLFAGNSGVGAAAAAAAVPHRDAANGPVLKGMRVSDIVCLVTAWGGDVRSRQCLTVLVGNQHLRKDAEDILVRKNMQREISSIRQTGAKGVYAKLVRNTLSLP